MLDSVEIDPKNVLSDNKGKALYNLKKYEEAIECCDKIIAIDPKTVSLRAYPNKNR
ncbi:MAG: tetratricopeptide repeat protein [Candidatus Nitrosopolaris sp.]